jgi:hypothetical protein
VRIWGVSPEFADPIRTVEVREHEDVEKLGAGSRAEGVQTRLQPPVERQRFSSAL